MKKLILILLLVLGLVFLSLPFLDSSPYHVIEDPDGVPIVDYGWLMGRYVGERRYPVTIASTAEHYYLSYKNTGDEKDLQRFMNNVKWLKQNRMEVNDFTVFPSDFDYPFYGCEAGWVSAMAQGFALKDFLYAYEVTGDAEYPALARSVLNAYHVEIDEGGILYIDPVDGGFWYAEYACGTPPRVLNGFWYALDGLYYYHNVTGDEDSLALYQAGVAELKRHLGDFDSGGWTYYDLERYPADETYHPLHVEIVKRIYEQTGDPVFLTFHEKWRAYNYSPLRFNKMLQKNVLSKLII